MTADFALLGARLQAELDAGLGDATVDDGLDALLRQQARDERPGSAVLRMIAALPAEGYRSLDADARRTWVRRALATVQRELDGPPAKTRTTRAAGRKAKRPVAPTTGATPTSPAKAAKRQQRPARAPRAKIAPGAAGLDTPIMQAATGLRAANLTRLERLGIATIGDALRHYPYRHHDFSQVVPITALQADREQTIQGRVERSREIRMGRGGRMRAAEVTISDASGASIRATWFNQPFIVRSLPSGAEVAIAGKVTIYRGRPAFQNPEFERLDTDHGARHTGRLVPVYHLTQGLPQRTLRDMIAKLLETHASRLEDPLPEEMRARHGLMPIIDAVRQVHYPNDAETLVEARHRLAFDELLAIQICVQARKKEWQASGDAPVVKDHAAADDFLASLPFELTSAQQRALGDLRRDLATSVPMSRLLEGDVGSGKTVVALAAILSTVAAGYQAVLMAPTEVLAEQHFRTLCTLLSGEPEPPLNGLVTVPGLPLQLKIVLLTGSTRAKQRREAVEAIRHGGAHIIVGTHALIQKGVDYHHLGLAVVDEQHRFGVMQRSELRRKGSESAAARGASITPHLLVMTATPIPRSLALTVYGDLDLTVIDELPPGRTPIETHWLPPDRRSEAFGHVAAEITAGRQAFVICPLVEGSEAVQSRAASEEYERLQREEFPELADRILLLHGRMAARTKDKTMRAFSGHEADILVSTAVVEVGIDIQNATVMVIEGADRFGLAQLHQFRGRVGRGEHGSFCYLLADDPSEDAAERLSIMERTTDGFMLAQADLEQRGPGDLFGTAQSGLANLRIASLLDAPLIDATRREAERLIEDDPDLKRPEHQALKVAVATRGQTVVHETH